MSLSQISPRSSVGEQATHHYLSRPRADLLKKDSTSEIVPPFFSRLRAAGLDNEESSSITRAMAQQQNTPFYVGRLLNGKTYLVSTGDEVYYGNSGNMVKVPVTEAYRNKSIDHPKRVLTLENGLRITIEGAGAKKKSTVQKKMMGLWLPIPHRFKSALH